MAPILTVTITETMAITVTPTATVDSIPGYTKLGKQYDVLLPPFLSLHIFFMIRYYEYDM